MTAKLIQLIFAVILVLFGTAMMLDGEPSSPENYVSVSFAVVAFLWGVTLAVMAAVSYRGNFGTYTGMLILALGVDALFHAYFEVPYSDEHLSGSKLLSFATCMLFFGLAAIVYGHLASLNLVGALVSATSRMKNTSSDVKSDTLDVSDVFRAQLRYNYRWAGAWAIFLTTPVIVAPVNFVQVAIALLIMLGVFAWVAYRSVKEKLHWASITTELKTGD